MNYYRVALYNMKVGDIFDYRGQTFEVCEAEKEGGCEGCYFIDDDSPCPPSTCTGKVFKLCEGLGD